MTQYAETDVLKWKIHGKAHADIYPDCLTTLRPLPASTAIPIEVALLLPMTDGNRALLAAIERQAVAPGSALGLCLVDPFLHLTSVSERLAQHEVRWVANFPSVAQHDPAFESYLDDVNLGLRNELDNLRAFKDLGFRTLSVMSHEKDAALVAAANPNAVVHIPNVANFLSGVLDQPTLDNKETAMLEALNAQGWSGPFIRYRVSRDMRSGVEPILVRP